MKRKIPWLLFLLPIIPLWRCLFLGETLGPWDHIRAMLPWNMGPAKSPFDVLQMDAALQFYGWRDLVFEGWRRHEIPLWNPYVFSGTPLMANSQSGALYPPHVILGFLGIPTGLAITLLAWFHLSIAGFGVWRLVRALGGTNTGATLAGAAFAMSPWMLNWLGIASVPSTVCWLPLGLSFLVEVFRGGLAVDSAQNSSDQTWRGRRSRGPEGGSPSESGETSNQLEAEHPSDTPQSSRAEGGTKGFLPSAGLAISFGFMLLAGHLQFAFYGVIAFLIVGLTLLVQSRNLKSAGLSMSAMALGFLIAAPQVLSALEWSRESHRRAPPTEEGYAAYSRMAMQPYEWMQIGAPGVLGSPSKFVGETGVSEYWPAIVRPGANNAESAVGVGVVILALAIAASVARQRGTALMGAIVLLGFLLASDTLLAKALYFGLPGFNSTGSPGRAGILVVLGLCVMAGLVQPKPLKKPSLKDPLSLGLFVAAMVCVLGGIVARAVAPTFQPDNQAIQQYLASALHASTLPGPIGVILVIVMGYAYRKNFNSLAPMMGVALAITLGYAWILNPVRTGTPPPKVDLGTSRYVAVIRDHWSFVTPVAGFAPPNALVPSRIKEVAGYDSLISKATVEDLKKLNDADPAPPENGNMMFVKSKVDPMVLRERLREMGVGRIWSQKDLGLSGGEARNGHFVYPIGDSVRSKVDGIAAYPKVETLNTIRFEEVAPGRMVHRSRYHPDWRVYLDGKPAPLIGNTWLEVDVPRGTRVVEFRFEPDLKWPLAITGWLGILALCALNFSRRRLRIDSQNVDNSSVQPVN